MCSGIARSTNDFWRADESAPIVSRRTLSASNCEDRQGMSHLDNILKQTRRNFIGTASAAIGNLIAASPFNNLVRASVRSEAVDQDSFATGIESGSAFSFDHGWRFHEGPLTGAEMPAFDDRRWRTVDLPHDWSIESPPDSSAQQGPFNKETPDGQSVGYLRGGTGWYRKSFVLPQSHNGRALDIIFDGVQQESEVWINGNYLGLQPHGSIGFTYDLTRHLNPAGQRNFIAVRAINPERNSRWYAGSGIYRGVTLRSRDALHIPVWGLRVDTIWLKQDEAQLQVRVEIRNDRMRPEHIKLRLTLHDPDKAVQTFDLGTLEIAPQSSESVSEQVHVLKPQPWSPASPGLYQCDLQLMQGERVVDTFRQTMGIRTIEVSAGTGLLLNGKQIKLKGGCMHQDNGLLGAAAFPQAEERRVALMKRNGFNAIRTSHNPPSSAFLDACDRLGMMVVEEFTDMWEIPKKLNGYSRYFDGHWHQDLSAMVARDFHHPSVLIWSIGNEIPERIAPSGLEIAAGMVALLHSLDSRRPVTNAINSFSDDPQGHRDWDASAPAFALLDIAGYNYMWGEYKSDHIKFPARIMVGTESNPDLALENWRLVEQNPYVIGDFVWTGMDHIGESGLGGNRYIPDGQPSPERITLAKPWPAWINGCGDIDIIGNKKPQSFYRDVVWGESEIEILVHAPIPTGEHEVTSYWGWPDELPSWNWRGCEGKTLLVKVHSQCPRVRLELNGRLIGEQTIDPSDGITARFNVPYEPGTLRASALVGSNTVATRVIETSGAASSIVMKPDVSRQPQQDDRLIFVPIEIHDGWGRLVQDAACSLTFSIDGPAKLVVCGSGNPEDDPFTHGRSVTTFRGRALSILCRTGASEAIRLTCFSPDLASHALNLGV
jgi:beta-galactosidase